MLFTGVVQYQLFGRPVQYAGDPAAVELGKLRHKPSGEQKKTAGTHHHGSKLASAKKLGKRGGKRGGPARAKSLTGPERSAIARKGWEAMRRKAGRGTKSGEEEAERHKTYAAEYEYGDLARYAQGEPCKDGETAAKTGCTPEQGGGGQQQPATEGEQRPAAKKEKKAKGPSPKQLSEALDDPDARNELLRSVPADQRPALLQAMAQQWIQQSQAEFDEAQVEMDGEYEGEAQGMFPESGPNADAEAAQANKELAAAGNPYRIRRAIPDPPPLTTQEWEEENPPPEEPTEWTGEPTLEDATAEVQAEMDKAQKSFKWAEVADWLESKGGGRGGTFGEHMKKAAQAIFAADHADYEDQQRSGGPEARKAKHAEAEAAWNKQLDAVDQANDAWEKQYGKKFQEYHSVFETYKEADQPKGQKQKSLFHRADAPVRYENLFGSGGEDASGRWITIGAKGPPGNKHGGSRVFIKDGKIVKGHSSLAGKTISGLKGEDDKPKEPDLPTGKDAKPVVTKAAPKTAEQKAAEKQAKQQSTTEYRAELRESRKVARQQWGEKAKAEGIDPEDLSQLTAHMMAEDAALVGDKVQMLKEARRALAAHGGDFNTMLLNAKQGRGKEEGDQVKGLNEVADDLYGDYPEQFETDDHTEELFQMLSAKNPETTPEDTVFGQALNILIEKKRSAANINEDSEPDVWEPEAEGEFVGAGVGEDGGTPFQMDYADLLRYARPLFRPVVRYSSLFGGVVRYAQGQPCAPGERADLTGCTPVNQGATRAMPAQPPQPQGGTRAMPVQPKQPTPRGQQTRTIPGAGPLASFPAVPMPITGHPADPDSEAVQERDKWRETLGGDSSPNIDAMNEFLGRKQGEDDGSDSPTENRVLSQEEMQVFAQMAQQRPLLGKVLEWYPDQMAQFMNRAIPISEGTWDVPDHNAKYAADDETRILRTQLARANLLLTAKHSPGSVRPETAQAAQGFTVDFLTAMKEALTTELGRSGRSRYQLFGQPMRG